MLNLPASISLARYLADPQLLSASISKFKIK